MLQILELLIADPKFSIISRRSPDKSLKLIVEVADIIIAQLHADFRYILVRGD